MIHPETLSNYFTVDFEAGRLWWRPRPVEWFKSGGHSAEHSCNAWNAKNAGKPALHALDNNGYRSGVIHRKRYKQHRVIFAMAHLYWPDLIDHMNGVRDDNRLANLRSVSFRENMQNRVKAPPKSGFIGVRELPNGKFQARIGCENRSLGTFDTAELAAQARADELKRLGYSDRHA